jgi:hypothetical protein
MIAGRKGVTTLRTKVVPPRADQIGTRIGTRGTDSTQSCPITARARVQYFSQPTYQLPVVQMDGTVTGVPVGDVNNNNALAVNGIHNTFQRVAAYFDPPCGNGICEPSKGENCMTCPEDCVGGTWTAEACGNGI